MACRLILASAASGQRSFPTQRLFQMFRSPEGILQAPLRQLENVDGLHPLSLRAMLSERDLCPNREQLDSLVRQNIQLVAFDSPHYPESLRRIPDPPPVLFLKGTVQADDACSIAVIGSRHPTAYGLAVCKMLVQGLVQQGFCIVSGMAKGIDAMAHWTAVENHGRTLGVLGTGVDVAYPKSNAALFPRIPAQGSLVSEFLPGTQARPENFPRRNRLIAGLAWGVLVVEASERSGTMITVRLALEQGKEIFAVPGDIRSSVSRGTHRLIQQGAKLVTGIEDILEELEHLSGAGKGHAGSKPGASMGEEEGGQIRSLELPADQWRKTTPGGGLFEDGTGDPEAIARLIDDVGVGLDALVHRTGWPMDRIYAFLTELELSGEVKRLPGNRYVRSR